MAVPRFPLEDWDPFFRNVQRDLVERFDLKNVTIFVDRHDGKNKNVGITLSPNSEDSKEEAESLHEDRPSSHKHLTLSQLTAEIHSTLNVLLKGCMVEYGDVIFIVKHGVLRNTVFAFSTRPEEPSRQYFTNL